MPQNQKPPFAGSAKALAKANYGNVGIREIGAAAGVNPALISRYFGSKRNLFL